MAINSLSDILLDRREHLAPGTVLELFDSKKVSAGNFTIERYIGCGGSSICYEATRGSGADMKRGRLKEIYPYGEQEPFYYLGRNEQDHQVMPKNEQQARQLEIMIDSIRKAYEKMESVRTSSESGSVLNNFVPDAYLYTGLRSGKMTTLYIWTPSDKVGISFDEYLSSLEFKTNFDAALSLRNIINSVITLTKCVIALHEEGLLHLDIKPENFLVCVDSFNKINPHAISMFDCNTVLDMNNREPETLIYGGTEGFAAPDLTTDPSVRCDIFSIAATLYYALSADSKGRRSCYHYSQYMLGMKSLKEDIKKWKILSSASKYLDVQFSDTLYEILDRAFSGRTTPGRFYSDGKELLEDLERLRNHLSVNDASADKDDPIPETYSRRVIQDLIYETPLYTHADGRELNVLVLGTGQYSCHFIDACLQVGQMIYKEDDGSVGFRSLNVSVFSRDAKADMENYIRHRAMLPEFFNINGSLDNCEKEVYGVLDYKEFSELGGSRTDFVIPDSIASPKTNAGLTGMILDQCPDVQYVFIALGNDNLNHSVAQYIARRISDQGRKAVVAFEWSSGKNVPDMLDGMVSVWLSEDVKKRKRKVNANLEQMAFNTHLSWCGSATDLAAIHKDFKKNYNYNSSVLYALSLRYKLYALGISDEDIFTAADQYRKMVLEQEGQSLFEYLVALEHRRWVVEKITLGWKALTKDGKPDVSYIVERCDTKDKYRKLHPCLVRSNVGASFEKAGFTRADWDGKGNLGKLDELDRISVLIHRYLKSASKIEGINEITTRLEGLEGLACDLGHDIVDAYNDLVFCVRNVKDGNAGYAGKFKSIFEHFKALIEKNTVITHKNRKKITDELEKIRTDIYPHCGRLKYEDFKSKDEGIIRSTPFILTHSDKRHLAVPLSTGSNDEVFRNVAAATLLIPTQITYLGYCDSNSDIADTAKAIHYVNEFLRSRRFASQVNHYVACGTLTDAEKLHEAVSDACAVGSRETEFRVHFEILVCKDQFDAVRKLSDIIKECGNKIRDRKVDLFEVNDSFISSICMVEDIPRFRFDSARGKFYAVEGCDHISHISVSGKHALTVNDMFALKQAGRKSTDVPEYQKYVDDLWKIFDDNNRAWKNLCNAVCEYVEKEHVVQSFEVVTGGEQYRHTFFIPSYKKAVADKIIRQLSADECGVLSEKSRTEFYDSATVKVIAYVYIDPVKHKQKDTRNPSAEARVLIGKTNCVKLESALDRIGEVTAPEMVSVVQGKRGCFNLMLHRLDIDDMEIVCDKESHIRDMTALLNELSKAAGDRMPFIRKMMYDKPLFVRADTDNIYVLSVSFRFVTRAIMDIFMQAGRILEVYTYYQLKATGYFDDIISSHEINWEGTDVTNELDCVLTKGFRSVFIECKATARLEQEFYMKLASLTSQFGINATPVLIADTREREAGIYTENNATQRLRGEQLGIITISDMKDIGKTLISILEKKYE